MNTKVKSGSIWLVIGLLAILLFASCNNNSTKHQVNNAHWGLPKSNNPEQLITLPSGQVLSRQSTIKPLVAGKTDTLKVSGYIDMDRSRNLLISARFGGRVEKLYIKYDLQHVKKGDKILELYSPELNTFQNEYLFLLRSGKEKNLLAQAREKLRLLGITDLQLAQLEQNQRLLQTITIYSPVDGYVFFNSPVKSGGVDEVAKKSTMESMSMNEGIVTENAYSSTSAQVREGMYINRGEAICFVNDLEQVWALVSVPAEFQTRLTENSLVKVSSELSPSNQLDGKITLVEKAFEETAQRFVRVRITLANPKIQLKTNSLITAVIPLAGTANFQLPVSAVFRSGLSAFVWIKIGKTKQGVGVFRLQKVTTGTTTNGFIAITGGLTVNDPIAEHAGYLIDSESFVNDNGHEKEN